MTELTPFIRNFILHWGELGTKWGINRTVAQIHAYLFISEEPKNAEDICNDLGVARSNVSNSLKELQNWGIVKVVHLPGDRRDHFQSMTDVYEMFRVIAEERKRREVDPALRMLRDCSEEANAAEGKEELYARQKLEELHDFFDLFSDFYNAMNKLPTKKAVKAAKMGDKLIKTLGMM
ncbi:MAG: MarR family transcriptional regulator [Verrucomicrobiales bacterium]|nr:MarR family transcriptional regulator [Verrucomicrobiales bacterium]